MAKQAKKAKKEGAEGQKKERAIPKRELLPQLRPGMVVRVHQLITGGEKERIQVFEGTIISIRGGTSQGATFTVRKVSDGIGVERIFPLHSPLVLKVEVVKQIKVHRAKLFYLRDYGKRLKEGAMK